jgi:hypothetical protein
MKDASHWLSVIKGNKKALPEILVADISKKVSVKFFR